ncbi:hypothetical protein [Actinomadura parmotrematis]|uniref:Amine oxidase domain-containing protein n=1 Tax=Actinomadura parmotrematis TaxID=2864039 RepID=A0ABS7G2T3_9ACTN|nr:hypothetical protein [Actinomadura parmotrematis]MBW8486841.1 hypothetical protein [Actinomadura parmotrematis]
MVQIHQAATGRSRRDFLRAAGRVLYAGDGLSYMDAWQHGAILSAREAVTALHARALKG